MSPPRLTENRKEPRYEGAGAVTIWSDDSQLGEIEGRLVDLSPGGFRMVHSCTRLTAGQTVEFEHAGATGRAQVVWTRITSEQVETGFHVVEGAAKA